LNQLRALLVYRLFSMKRCDAGATRAST
jgi:hypothetical protein